MLTTRGGGELNRASGWESCSSSALDGAAGWERAGQGRCTGESRLELLDGRAAEQTENLMEVLDGRGLNLRDRLTTRRNSGEVWTGLLDS